MLKEQREGDEIIMFQEVITRIFLYQKRRKKYF